MDDLISRRAAIAYAISGRIRTLPTSEDGENWIRTEEVRQSLSTMPSAQSEIIRCRDCKYFAGEGMYCGQNICVQFDHFYCYYGERKE